MTLILLFGGIPGAPELLIMLLFFVVPVALAIFVWQDAREYTDHPVAWAVAVLVAGLSPFFVGSIAVTVLYFVVRDELGTAAPPTFGEADMDENAQVLGQRLGGGPDAGDTDGEDGFDFDEGADESTEDATDSAGETDDTDTATTGGSDDDETAASDTDDETDTDDAADEKPN